MRKCTGCLQMKNKKDLIRVVRIEADASFEFTLDFTGKTPGRGAYVCPDTVCLERARKQKGLERSFKQSIPPKIYDRLRGELAEHGS
ncbi:MAG: YlxR family protein [Defluviitaleaceae bacterium]|nr:YlxR family protein [Defluviitaleaceae bacterium]